jgi:hypothetical protein
LSAFVVLGTLACGGCGGCTDSSPLPAPGNADDSATLHQWREELLGYAFDNLNQLEEFNTSSMLQQIIDRLNRWVADQPPPEDWQRDPLLATLPEPLAELPPVKNLDQLEFIPYDGAALQEAVWLRDVSNWARGDQPDDLSRAKNLFDWTVRNIEL